MCLSNLNSIRNHKSPFHTNCCVTQKIFLISLHFSPFLSFLLLLFDFWLFVIWVFAQYDKILHNLSLAEVFLRGELGSLLLANQYRGVMSLETSDLLGLAGGADGINCVSNSDLRLYWFEAFIELNIDSWLLEGFLLTVISMRG